jgi:serine/threonine-protein kinase
MNDDHSTRLRTGTDPDSGRRPLVAVGERLAHYRIIRKIGAGGMGEVYHARDELLERDVAVKVLPASSFDDTAARARLVREAKSAAALNHPNVCTVHEVGEANGQAYIAMELVDGQLLSAKLTAGALSTSRLLHYGRQLADALAHAHERGVVHRDLKCANVIITADDRVKVLDFGLAKRSSDASALTQVQSVWVTEPGTIAGTLPYMAPEQLRGQGGTMSSDIWALGVMLYEMAAGRRPFQGQTAFDLSAAIINHDPPPLPLLQADLSAVIFRCLAKAPEQRYADGAEAREALTAIDISVSPVPSPKPAPPPAPIHVSFRLKRWHVSMLAALLVVAVSAALWSRWPTVAATRSLAVLPFDNIVKDADLDYLCDGIADSLIKRVTRMPAVRVTNINTVLALKGRGLDPAAAGRQLGVDTVLAGALERRDRHLVISARLVDVATGRQLWGNSYDREATALLDVQDEIATALVNEGLQVRLSSNERQELIRHPTADGDAYDLYLQARYLQRGATEEDYLYSRELLQRAIVRDPKFALAHAALSGNYAMMVTDGLERPTDAWPQVNRYMRRAIDLDPDLPEAHAFAHALAFLFDWDWAGAERARERLLEFPLGDFDPQMLRAMAMEHWALGRPQEALKLARRTRELDPLSASLAILEADYLLRDGQLDAAIALYEQAARTEPHNPNSYFGLAEARAKQGRYDEAIKARRTAHTAAGDTRLAPLFDMARGEAGYRAIEEAWVKLQLEELTQRATTAYVSPLDLARAFAQLGDRESAFRHLEAAFADRSPGLVFLKVDPAWNRVRDDPRLDEAIRRIGLP